MGRVVFLSRKKREQVGWAETNGTRRSECDRLVYWMTGLYPVGLASLTTFRMLMLTLFKEQDTPMPP
jgi:hypothetical protein